MVTPGNGEERQRHNFIYLVHNAAAIASTGAQPSCRFLAAAVITSALNRFNLAMLHEIVIDWSVD